MGSSPSCQSIQYFNMISLNACFYKPSVEKDENQIIIDLDSPNHKLGKKLIELKDYFHKVENELMNNNHNFNKTKKASKKHLSKKKHINALNKLSDNKYELMLKRLLEQKKIQRNGPKRRETIRKDKIIKQVVNEVLSGNVKNEEKDNDDKINEKENDLLIKNINDQKFRCSATLDRNENMINNLAQNQKKYNYKYYQYRNTMNDIINESSGYSGLCQKQTKQSNSPKKKEIDNI